MQKSDLPLIDAYQHFCLLHQSLVSSGQSSCHAPVSLTHQMHLLTIIGSDIRMLMMMMMMMVYIAHVETDFRTGFTIKDNMTFLYDHIGNKMVPPWWFK